VKTTADQHLIKRINRSMLLRLVRAQPGLSRSQIASASGLTKSTVSLLARELIEEGWLAENSNASSGGLGRPSTPLHINEGALCLMGVEVAVHCVRVAAVSLMGEVLWSAEEALESPLPEDVCRQTAWLVAQAHTELAVRGVRLAGVGVGLPGACDDATGVVRFAPNLGWRNVDFLLQITRALGEAGLPTTPVHVQNEADTGALGEYEFAQSASDDTLIFIACGAGVGAGIVLNDHLFTGAQGMAGEIGHAILQIGGPLCLCGRQGCAETFIGAKALAQELRTYGHLRRAAQFLGVLVQNLWMAFNPDVFVLGGPSCLLHGELVSMAQDTLQTYATSAGMTAPVVRTARYGLLASAVGAAALVLHYDLRPMHLRPSDPATALRGARPIFHSSVIN
jgi:predicted NBD/HSP70 family sugar kinase